MNLNAVTSENAELQKKVFWTTARKSLTVIPDIHVKAGNYEWQAHSGLILQHSGHFRRLREADTEETKIGHLIHFKDEQLVARMLAWLNGSPNYNGSCSAVLYHLNPSFTLHDFMSINRIDPTQPADHACGIELSVINHIDLFLFALKFEMPSFTDACILDIEIALHKCCKDDCVNTLRHVYTLDSTACAMLSKSLAKIASSKCLALQGGGDLRAFMADHPDFHWEVTKNMAQTNAAMAVVIKEEEMKEERKAQQQIIQQVVTPLKLVAKKRKGME